MIDHISYAVKNFDQSLKFYDQTLTLLGYERLMTFDDEDNQVAGYGKDGKPSFWIGMKKELTEDDQKEHVGRAAGFM